MKNLLIYISPDKKFTEEDEKLVKIQIDNSLDLGWDRSDILLVTNFEYIYDIPAIVIPDDVCYKFDYKANKIAVVLYLMDNGFIQPREIYWCHDLDAYELNKIGEIDLEKKSLGIVHYLYKQQWSLSNFFFNLDSKHVFRLIHKTTLERPYKSRNNEKTLTWLIKHHKIRKHQYKKLNVTFNVAKRCIDTVYREADKPLKVLHFRPSDKDALMEYSALDMFMYGKNSLHLPLMTDRLINIFKNHGIS